MMIAVCIIALGIMLATSGDIMFCYLGIVGTYLGIVGTILWCRDDIQDSIAELKKNQNINIPVVVKDVIDNLNSK